MSIILNNIARDRKKAQRELDELRDAGRYDSEWSRKYTAVQNKIERLDFKKMDILARWNEHLIMTAFNKGVGVAFEYEREPR
jgi:hypothetical protein